MVLISGIEWYKWSMFVSPSPDIIERKRGMMPRTTGEMPQVCIYSESNSTGLPMRLNFLIRFKFPFPSMNSHTFMSAIISSTWPDKTSKSCFAKRKKIKTPLLNSVLKSNEAHIDCALETILRTGKDKVGIFGLSFKEGSDDLRESSLLKLASSLLKRGKRVKIYDKNLSLSEIHGANERYLKNLIQDPYQVIVSSPSDVVNFADVIVIGLNEDTYIKMATKRDIEKIIVDLIGALQGSELVNYYSLV